MSWIWQCLPKKKSNKSKKKKDRDKELLNADENSCEGKDSDKESLNADNNDNNVYDENNDHGHSKNNGNIYVENNVKDPADNSASIHSEKVQHHRHSSKSPDASGAPLDDSSLQTIVFEPESGTHNSSHVEYKRQDAVAVNGPATPAHHGETKVPQDSHSPLSLLDIEPDSNTQNCGEVDSSQVFVAANPPTTPVHRDTKVTQDSDSPSLQAVPDSNTQNCSEVDSSQVIVAANPPTPVRETHVTQDSDSPSSLSQAEPVLRTVSVSNEMPSDVCPGNNYYHNQDISEVCAKGKYRYTAKSQDELTINEFDIIRNVKSVDNTWSQGVLKGKSGRFPTDYVIFEETTDEEDSGINDVETKEDEDSVLDGDNGDEYVQLPTSPVGASQESDLNTDAGETKEEDSVDGDDNGQVPAKIETDASQESDPGNLPDELCTVKQNQSETGNESETTLENVALPETVATNDTERQDPDHDASHSVNNNEEHGENDVPITDQGGSKNCTTHAIGKALYRIFGIDASILAHCLNQRFKGLNGVNPEEYNGCLVQATKPNGEAGLIIIIVKECKMEEMYNNYEYILVYKQDKDSYHCVYMQDKKEDSFVCINSWGIKHSKVDIGFSEVSKIYKIGGRWEPEKNLREPTMEMLSFGDISTIAAPLDNLSGNNWSDFGMKLVELYEELQLMKSEIRDLHRYYCGGGSPALELFKWLAVKDQYFTAGQFSGIAKKIQRNDIVQKITGWSAEDTFLKDLHEEKLKELARMLDLIRNKNWKVFADKVGFSFDDILKIEESLRGNAQYSPTEQLFTIIRSRNKDFRLCYLRNVFAVIGRNDVVDILNPIIETYKKSMFTTPKK